MQRHLLRNMKLLLFTLAALSAAASAAADGECYNGQDFWVKSTHSDFPQIKVLNLFCRTCTTL